MRSRLDLRRLRGRALSHRRRRQDLVRDLDESLVVNTIALHPQRPGRVILGVEGDGVYVSNDDAKTFTRTCDGLAQSDHHLDRRRRRAAEERLRVGRIRRIVERHLSLDRRRRDVEEAQPTNDLPQVLSLVITEDAEVKFVAGTEKGFFWSADGEEWTQAPPASYPIRVDKVLRFNKVRYFAATAEGVFTSRDAGKSWYRLAGADNRAVDIAVGNLGEKRALFALTNAGLRAFDGMQWMPIDGAPAKGRTLAVRGSGDDQLVFVAGSQGVKAGHVDADGKWTEMEAPDAQFASVFGGSRSTDNFVFLTSRQQHQMLVAEPKNVRLALVPAAVVDRRGDVGRPRPLRHRPPLRRHPRRRHLHLRGKVGKVRGEEEGGGSGRGDGDELDRASVRPTKTQRSRRNLGVLCVSAVIQPCHFTAGS